MLIQCPRCSTGWRVADTPPTDNPVFKCGRCHHLFRQFPGAPEEGERRSVSTKRRTRPPDGDNLEFIFPDPPDGAADPPDDAMFDIEDETIASAEAPDADTTSFAPEDPGLEVDDTSDAAADEPLALLDDATDIDADAEADDALTLTADEAAPDTDEATLATDEAAPSTAEPDADDETAPLVEDTLVPADADLSFSDDAAEDDDDSTAQWAHELEALGEPQPLDTSRVLHVEDAMPRSYGFGTIARSLLAIVALHALLALTIRVAPSYASAWLSRIPVAGDLLADEPTITQRVELRNVAGTFQQLRNARRVFVISGEAVNRSPASIDRIEVEGTLYSGDGRVEQKVVNAGNRTTLRDLSEKEIAMLQRLSPRRIVAPGESSSFLIVFLEPPRTVREFSSRVLNVRSTRRLAQPSTAPRRASHPDPVG